MTIGTLGRKIVFEVSDETGPEDVSMAATPPSSSQIFCATQSLVGFWSLV